MRYEAGEFLVMRLLKLEHAPFHLSPDACVYSQGVSKLGNQSKPLSLSKAIVTEAAKEGHSKVTFNLREIQLNFAFN
jgi:hypothetical protein